MNEETLFHQAREKQPGERAAFLDEACAGDAALRQRVEALLRADQDPSSILDRPVLERAAEMGGALAQQGLPHHHPESIAEAETVAPRDYPPAGSAPGTRIRYFGDYEIFEKIAEGGMGVVYKARQISLNRTVAVKMILAGQLASEADVQRFQREAEAAANLYHPNIVPIYEIGEHEGQHYFSMQLIDGTSLAQRAASFVRDPKSAVKLLAKVARAVHAAHQRGVIHRDLKPGNILLNAQDEPYVTDFGLAKHVDGRSPLTRTGDIVGTASYMAPEQARSEMATVAVDVYGLGAILYELLTGRPPFRAKTDLDTILQVLDRDPPRLRAVNSRIDRDLETICLKCLEKESRNRYSSALALAEDLERWLGGQTIQARPSGPAKRVLKWAKRNPALAILLVVLVCWRFNLHLPPQWVSLELALYGVLMLQVLSGLVVVCRRALGRPPRTPLDLVLDAFFLPGAVLTMFLLSFDNEWALYGVLMVLVLWRLVVVCRRALGRPAGTPLDLVLDAFFLPGAVLAMFLLYFYHGDLEDQKSLASAIVFTSYMWGLVIQWLWRRTQAGLLFLALRPSRPAVIILGVILGLVLIGGIYGLIQVSGQTEDPLVNVCFWIFFLSGGIWLFLRLAVGIEIRKQGLVTFYACVPWEEIEWYSWRQSSVKDVWKSVTKEVWKDVLFLRLKQRDNPVLLEKIVHPAKKEKVERILMEHRLEYKDPRTTPSRLSEEVKDLADDPARKISAIKLHREQTGLGLKEAKDEVEAYIGGRG